MAAVDNLRNNIIDKLLTITNKDYLTALYKIVGSTSTDQRLIPLSEEQKLMLQMSETDIKTGRLISQNDLDKNDLEWLRKI